MIGRSLALAGAPPPLNHGEIPCGAQRAQQLPRAQASRTAIAASAGARRPADEVAHEARNDGAGAKRLRPGACEAAPPTRCEAVRDGGPRGIQAECLCLLRGLCCVVCSYVTPQGGKIRSPIQTHADNKHGTHHFVYVCELAASSELPSRTVDGHVQIALTRLLRKRARPTPCPSVAAFLPYRHLALYRCAARYKKGITSIGATRQTKHLNHALKHVGSASELRTLPGREQYTHVAAKHGLSRKVHEGHPRHRRDNMV